MPDYITQGAIDTVARFRLHVLYEMWTDSDYGGWEDYPDIGEYDWDRVKERMALLLPSMPSMDEFKEAYGLLSARARDALTEDTDV